MLAELLGTPSIYRVLGHPPPLYSELLRQPVIMYLLYTLDIIINIATATGLELNVYRVFKLDLHQKNRLLGHQKCTFKS